MNIQQLKYDPLSNTEIEEEFRKLKEDVNIVIMAKMDHINNIEDLFNGTNHVVLFIATTAPNNGHWQLFLRQHDKILFFDSYGQPFSYILKAVNGKFNQTDKLAKIIVNSRIPCTINTVKYQSTARDISTCGYHILTCFAVFLSMEKEFTFEIYKEFLDNYRRRFNLKTYDDAVIRIVRV